MAEYSLFSGVPSVVAAGGETSPVSLGTEFYVTETCWAVGLRGLQPSLDGDWTTAKTMALYSTTDGTTGTLIWGPFTVPIDDNFFWQTTRPETPLQLDPGVRYRVAVFHPTGRYPATGEYFTTGAGSTNTVVGPLVMPSAANALANLQGSFLYGASPGFPDGAFGGGAYYSDVIVTDVPPAGTPETASVAFSGAGALTVATTVAFALTVALSGSGVLVVAGDIPPETTIGLTGSGTLSTTVKVAFLAATSLTGAGTLTGSTTAGRNTTVALSSTGTLTVTGAQRWKAIIPFDSEGKLTLGLAVGLKTSATLEGSGELIATPVDVPLAQFLGDSEGTLTTTTSVAIALAANLTGSGHLLFRMALSGRDVVVLAYLPPSQRHAALPDNRWEARLE